MNEVTQQTKVDLTKLRSRVPQDFAQILNERVATLGFRLVGLGQVNEDYFSGHPHIYAEVQGAIRVVAGDAKELMRDWLVELHACEKVELSTGRPEELEADARIRYAIEILADNLESFEGRWK